MSITNKLLPTTVVGSYPVVKAKGLWALANPLHGALETAVAEQIKAGIDIISDGQVTGDMISAITLQLPGIKGTAVKGPVRPPAKPITVANTKYALSKHPKVKGILTGPTTLAHALKIDTPSYRNRNELVPDIAQALAVEAINLEKAGVTIIQIDEPILSTGVANIHTAIQGIDAITAMLRVPTCIHVCGTLESVIDEVLKVQVDIFDFEFANNPDNLEVLSQKDLKGRMLGLGVVDSTRTDVDSVDLIKQRIIRGVDIFGAENLLIDPDCGLRMHTRDTAFGKLQNMVKAANEVRNEL